MIQCTLEYTWSACACDWLGHMILTHMYSDTHSMSETPRKSFAYCQPSICHSEEKCTVSCICPWFIDEICHGAYSKNNAMICKIHLSCSMKVNCHGPNVAEVSSSVLFLCLNRQQTFYSFCVCTDLLNYWWFFVGWPIRSGMEAHISWADFCPYESRGPYGLWPFHPYESRGTLWC